MMRGLSLGCELIPHRGGSIGVLPHFSRADWIQSLLRARIALAQPPPEGMCSMACIRQRKPRIVIGT